MRTNAMEVCAASGLLGAILALGAYSAAAGNAGIVKLPQDITFNATRRALKLPSSMATRQSLVFTSYA